MYLHLIIFLSLLYITMFPHVSLLPQNNNPHEWLQVDLEKVRRITGVITQGARSLMTQMMVTEFSVTSSLDGHSWSSVLDDRARREKVGLVFSFAVK